MRPSTTRPLRAALSLLAAALLSLTTGCSALLGTRREPPQLYVLSTQPAARTHVIPPSLLLGFGPADLPGYLDRQGIVTRIAENRLEESRNDLWAQSLGSNFRSVLEQDLRSRLPGAPMRTFPWSPGSAQPDLAVSVEVSRFEGTNVGTVELQARWVLRKPQDKTVLGVHESALVEPVGGTSTEDVVAAMSRALGALSDEIAAELARRATALQPARRRTETR